MEKKTFERPIIRKIQAGMPSKYGMQPIVQPLTRIDGISAHELIHQFGSPLHVISETTIRNTYKKAHQAFSTRYPKVQFAWSYKTNYLDAVCNIFHQQGAWAEVVSGMEYDKAIANGVNGNKIIFNGPGKSKKELTKAIKLGSLIHIDHFDELFLIIAISKESEKQPKIAIRINMDTGIYPQWDRFGFNYENGEAWEAINRILLSDTIDLVGLHTHIGTYILSTNAYKVAASKLISLAESIHSKYNFYIQYIDLGGGFASSNKLKGAYYPGTDTVPSFDEYAEAISSAFLRSNILPEHLPMLILETGRALIDEAGFIVGSVIANKRLADGRRSMVIDVGVNLLFTSFWYDHEVVPACETDAFTEDTTIYGPLCMNIDVIRQAIEFPVMKKGEPIIIKRTGAYNMTQWLQFITYRPSVVLIDTDESVHQIRQAETLYEINHLESIPKHLKP